MPQLCAQHQRVPLRGNAKEPRSDFSDRGSLSPWSLGDSNS
ncbi:hypothetical protein ACFPRL_16170 [Pseudoclavibacter helvolus]